MKTKFEKAAKEGAVSALEKIKLYRVIAIDAPQGVEIYYRERLSKIKSDTELSKDIGSLCRQWVVAGCPHHLQFEDSLEVWVDNIDNHTQETVKWISASNVNSYCERMDKTNDKDAIEELTTACLKNLEELRKHSEISIADGLLEFWELYYTVKLLEAEIEKASPVNYKPLWEDLKPYLDIGLADFSRMMKGKPVERKGKWLDHHPRGEALKFTNWARIKKRIFNACIDMSDRPLHAKDKSEKNSPIDTILEKHKDLLK